MYAKKLKGVYKIMVVFILVLAAIIFCSVVVFGGNEYEEQYKKIEVYFNDVW